MKMDQQEKRSYARRSTIMPFEVRRLQPEEAAALRCRISQNELIIDATSPISVQDERLFKYLNMLNTKIDYLVAALAQAEKSIPSIYFEPVNMSGSGMSLLTKEKFTPGDAIEVRMVIQVYPSKILYLVGAVVRIKETQRDEGTYMAAIKFLNMDEEVRKEILNFDFEKHRARLVCRPSA
jgi:hypothetical protein